MRTTRRREHQRYQEIRSYKGKVLLKKKNRNQKEVVRNYWCVWYLWNPEISRLIRKLSLNVTDVSTPYRIFSKLRPGWPSNTNYVNLFAQNPVTPPVSLRIKTNVLVRQLHDLSHPLSLTSSLPLFIPLTPSSSVALASLWFLKCASTSALGPLL